MKPHGTSRLSWCLALAGWAAGCAAVGGAAPTGSDEKIADEDAAKMKAVGRQGEGPHRLVQLARSATTTCSR